MERLLVVADPRSKLTGRHLPAAVDLPGGELTPFPGAVAR
jgi:hypothetical protein